MERALDARAVVIPERADVIDDERDVRLGDLAVEQADLGVGETPFGLATEVHDDLDERLAIRESVDRFDDLGRQRRQQHIEVVDGLALAVVGTHAGLLSHGYRTPAGTSAGSATRTSVSFMSSVTLAIVPKAASSRR